MTYSEEVEETLGTPMEVEPLDKTQLEDLGLNSCNNYIPLSYKEALIFDESELQPQPLLNCPSLDVSLGEERGLEPPIKPHSSDSFRMKGFTAVLAVLIIEASQSRQHGKSKSTLGLSNLTIGMSMALVLVVDAVYFLSVHPAFRYSRSLLKKKLVRTVRRPRDSCKGRGLFSFVEFTDLETVHSKGREFDKSAHQIIKGVEGLGGFLNQSYFGVASSLGCSSVLPMSSP
uniref:Uncharacterized protein n=1 Tax=Tanacetum cinerariifolium TaxID=118510 RepID=A0A6L2LX04_TANCI|nr:hypothetical protein [Tanacetum cinerariifolium]